MEKNITSIRKVTWVESYPLNDLLINGSILWETNKKSPKENREFMNKIRIHLGG